MEAEPTLPALQAGAGWGKPPQAQVGGCAPDLHPAFPGPWMPGPGPASADSPGTGPGRSVRSAWPPGSGTGTSRPGSGSASSHACSPGGWRGCCRNLGLPPDSPRAQRQAVNSPTSWARPATAHPHLWWMTEGGREPHCTQSSASLSWWSVGTDGHFQTELV